MSAEVSNHQPVPQQYPGPRVDDGDPVGGERVTAPGAGAVVAQTLGDVIEAAGPGRIHQQPDRGPGSDPVVWTVR